MKFLRALLPLAALFAAAQLADAAHVAETQIVISIRDQLMTIVRDKKRQAAFQVSTSKFGIGDTPGSYRTPLGLFRIDRKIGDDMRTGAVFKALSFTGEIVSPNAPGRDPIITRVLCLRGVEGHNGNANARGIYIHGTPEEKRIGKPASYGCIRMRSSDVIALFDAVRVGTRVVITDAPTDKVVANDSAADADWYR